MSFQLIPSGAKPIELNNFVSFMGKLKGRDKAMRFIQYVARFASFHMLKADPKSDAGGKLKNFYKAVGLHRKAFKLGMFLDEYTKFMEAFNDKKDDLKNKLTLALRSFLMIFTAYDNYVWLISVKAVGGDKDAVKLKSYYFRFIAAVINFILVGMSYQESSSKLQASPNDIKLKEKQGGNVLGLVKNSCDLLTYGTNTKWFPFLALDDGQMGLFGAVSAVAGGLPIWFKL